MISTDIQSLAQMMTGRRFLVLSGAGISVDSGIPDYRGPNTRHIERKPVQHDEFIHSAEARQRYWSRASRGYLSVGVAKPNAAHLALAELELHGLLSGVITQNVDGLHQAAGSREVIELHGSLHKVLCLACAKTYPRHQIQTQIEVANPGWIKFASNLAPDGDALVAPLEQNGFLTPLCRACGGDLMPDVVFFGGAVPKARTESAYRQLRNSDGLMVVGSSLTVYSGYRFVREAEKLNVPIAILNLGLTRGHRHASLSIDAGLVEVLPLLAKALTLEC